MPRKKARKEKIERKGAFEVHSICAVWFPYLSKILSWHPSPCDTWPCFLANVTVLRFVHHSETKLGAFPCLHLRSLPWVTSAWNALSRLSAWPAPASHSGLSSQLTLQIRPSMNSLSEAAIIASFVRLLSHPVSVVSSFSTWLKGLTIVLPYWNGSSFRCLSQTKRAKGLW